MEKDEIGKYGVADLIYVANHGVVPTNGDKILQIKAIIARGGIAKGIWQVDDKYLNDIGVSMVGFLTPATVSMMAYTIATKLWDNQLFTTTDLQTRHVFENLLKTFFDLSA